MQRTALDSLRNQLFMLERSVRAVRTLVETSLFTVEPAASRDDLPRPIPCGLNELLETCHRIPPFSPAPYEELFSGMRLAYPPEPRAMALTAEARGFERTSTRADDRGSSCLLLRARTQASEKRPWLTLEIDLDKATLASCLSFEARMVFNLHSTTPLPSGHYLFFLRLFMDKGHEDHGAKTLPALDVPLELSYQLSGNELAALPLSAASRILLIIGIPVGSSGDTRFVASHFELTGIRSQADDEPEPETAAD